MSISIETVTLVHARGVKKSWQIPHGCIIAVGERQFVRLTGRCIRGMKAMLFENNPSAPSDPPHVLNAGMCVGLSELIRIRNVDHFKEFAQEISKPSALFGDVADADLDQKPRVSRAHQLKLRADRQIISIAVPGGRPLAALQCLRPTQAQDTLTIEFEPASIETVIAFMRDEGFVLDSSFHKKDQSLPKGVTRKGGDKVIVKQDDGRTKFVSRSELATHMFEMPDDEQIDDKDDDAGNDESAHDDRDETPAIVVASPPLDTTPSSLTPPTKKRRACTLDAWFAS